MFKHCILSTFSSPLSRVGFEPTTLAILEHCITNSCRNRAVLHVPLSLVGKTLLYNCKGHGFYMYIPNAWDFFFMAASLGLFQPGDGARPPLELMAMLRAFSARMLSTRGATWLKKAERQRWISWLMGGRHVLWVTSLLMRWNHWMPRIDHWHLMWNDSSRLRSDLRRD